MARPPAPIIAPVSGPTEMRLQQLAAAISSNQVVAQQAQSALPVLSATAPGMPVHGQLWITPSGGLSAWDASTGAWITIV